MDNEQLKRIADAIEEILRLVKKDMEPRTKKKDWWVIQTIGPTKDLLLMMNGKE